MPKHDLVKGIDLPTATATFNAAGTTTSSSSGMEIHAIDGPWHTGTLAHSSLSGVGANDHHNQSHVLATNAALGGDHTISGATAGHVLRASSATAAAFAAIADADLPSTIVRTSRTITAGNGLTGGGDLSANRTIDVAVANTGATGLTVEVDAIRLTSSSAPGAAAAVLASTAAGALTLKAFAVNGTVGDATLDGTGARLSFSRVGANYILASAAGGTLRLGSNGTESDITLDGANTRILIGNSLPLRSDTWVAGTTGWNLSNAGTIDVRKVETQWVEVTGSAGIAQLDSTGARLNFSRNSANYISAGTAGGSLRLGSNAVDNDLIIDGANARIEVGNSNTLRTPNYVSQLTGWAVTYAGAADYRYIYTDELHAKAFIADLEQALAGGQIISKSVSLLGADFTCPAAGATATLTVKDLPSAENMAVFESGDIIRLRVFSRAGGSLTIANCWGVVTSYADQSNKLQTWTFTRSSGGNAGAVAAGTVIATDSIVLDYGTTGNGYYEVNSIDGLRAVNSPYAQVVTWATHPATGQTIRSRWGNLLGVTGVSGEFGLFAGQGVTDADGYLVASSTGLRLRNADLEIFNGANKTVDISTSGDMKLGTLVTAAATTSFDFVASTGVLRIGTLGSNKPNLYWDGTALAIRNNTTDVITLDGSGNSYFSGVMTLGTAGEIRQGTGTLGSNFTGLRIWRESSIGRIGGYNNNALQWYANTDGKLYAGAGKLAVDVTGIRLIPTETYVNTALGSPSFPSSPTWASILYSDSIADGGAITVGGGTVVYPGGAAGRIWNRLCVVADTASSNYGAYHDTVIEVPTSSPAVTSAGTPGPKFLRVLLQAGANYLEVLGSAYAAKATFNGNTIWHQGNDGSGSTLDADTLDTYEAAAFPRLAATNTFSTTNTFSAGVTFGSTIGVTGLSTFGNRLTVNNDNADDGIFLYLNSAEADKTVELRFGNNGTSVGRLIYGGANSAGSKYFGFNSSGADYFVTASDDTRWQNVSGATQYMKLTSGGLRIGTGSITSGYVLDVNGKALFGNGIRLATGDPTGAASTITYTGDTTTTTSSGIGTIKMRGTTNRSSDAWITVYIGTTKYYIPAFSNIDT